MPDTTYEQAKRCPQCKEPGSEVGTRKPKDAPRGTLIHIFECANTRCPNVDERWLVQTNPDGTIPQPGNKGPKTFQMPSQSSALMQRAREELAITDWLSTHPGATTRDARRALGGQSFS